MWFLLQGKGDSLWFSLTKMVIIYIITSMISTLIIVKMTKNKPNTTLNYVILPIFDSLEYIKEQDNFTHLNKNYNIPDIKQAQIFLQSYSGSIGTFNAYRREIERLLQWCALISKKSLKDLKREDIENYIQFCQKPPKQWIGLSKPSRFITKDAIRIPNPEWKPFIVTVTKANHNKGERPELKNFELSQGTIKEIFAIIGSFYGYLQQSEYALLNPITMIRQKSKFIRKNQSTNKIRRLSELQWHYVIQTAKELADQKIDNYERTLFIMSALYSMYLRISELVASKRWIPKMSDFARDSDNNWWFTTVGKGNKQRQIAVSDTMLEALKRWRSSLNLSPLPSLADNTFLIPKLKGKGPITSTNHIRTIVQDCFNRAIEELTRHGFQEDAESLKVATVHWLRHTGISDDVKVRPREHVRDDAGHSSGSITDKYIDVELRARHKSAKEKSIL